jgi:hypothetical protein
VVAVFPYSITLTVKHPPERDRHGDPLPDTAPPDTLIDGCVVAPRSTSEDLNVVFIGLIAYAPPGTTIAPADRVLVPGYAGEWEVDGMPGRWDLIGSPVSGVEIPLRRVG